MWFWLFMTLTVVSIPAVMLIIARVYEKRPPKYNHLLSGYRTKRSRKSPEAWAYAHERLCVYWKRIGWVMLIAAAACMLWFINGGEDTVAMAGSIVSMLEVIPMIGSIFFIERDLKGKFGE